MVFSLIFMLIVVTATRKWQLACGMWQVPSGISATSNTQSELSEDVCRVAFLLSVLAAELSITYGGGGEGSRFRSSSFG